MTRIVEIGRPFALIVERGDDLGWSSGKRANMLSMSSNATCAGGADDVALEREIAARERDGVVRCAACLRGELLDGREVLGGVALGGESDGLGREDPTELEERDARARTTPDPSVGASR